MARTLPQDIQKTWNDNKDKIRALEHANHIASLRLLLPQKGTLPKKDLVTALHKRAKSAEDFFKKYSNDSSITADELAEKQKSLEDALNQYQELTHKTKASSLSDTLSDEDKVVVEKIKWAEKFNPQLGAAKVAQNMVFQLMTQAAALKGTPQHKEIIDKAVDIQAKWTNWVNDRSPNHIALEEELKEACREAFPFVINGITEKTMAPSPVSSTARAATQIAASSGKTAGDVLKTSPAASVRNEPSPMNPTASTSSPSPTPIDAAKLSARPRR